MCSLPCRAQATSAHNCGLLARILFQPFLFRPDLGCCIHLTGGALGGQAAPLRRQGDGQSQPRILGHVPQLRAAPPEHCLFSFMGEGSSGRRQAEATQTAGKSRSLWISVTSGRTVGGGVSKAATPPQSSPESGYTGLPVDSNRGQGPGVLGWVAVLSLSRLRPQETWGVYAGVSISQNLS